MRPAQAVTATVPLDRVVQVATHHFPCTREGEGAMVPESGAEEMEALAVPGDVGATAAMAVIPAALAEVVGTAEWEMARTERAGLEATEAREARTEAAVLAAMVVLVPAVAMADAVEVEAEAETAMEEQEEVAVTEGRAVMRVPREVGEAVPGAQAAPVAVEAPAEVRGGVAARAEARGTEVDRTAEREETGRQAVQELVVQKEGTEERGGRGDRAGRTEAGVLVDRAAQAGPEHRVPMEARDDLSDSLLFQRFLPSQHVVIVLREAVRLVADRLAQTQPRVLAPEPDRLVPLLHVDQLFLLRQRDHHRRAHVQRLERFERRVQLPQPAIDQDDIGVQLVPLARLSIPA